MSQSFVIDFHTFRHWAVLPAIGEVKCNSPCLLGSRWVVSSAVVDPCLGPCLCLDHGLGWVGRAVGTVAASFVVGERKNPIPKARGVGFTTGILLLLLLLLGEVHRLLHLWLEELILCGVLTGVPSPLVFSMIILHRTILRLLVVLLCSGLRCCIVGIGKASSNLLSSSNIIEGLS